MSERKQREELVALARTLMEALSSSDDADAFSEQAAPLLQEHARRQERRRRAEERRLRGESRRLRDLRTPPPSL